MRRWADIGRGSGILEDVEAIIVDGDGWTADVVDSPYAYEGGDCSDDGEGGEAAVGAEGVVGGEGGEGGDSGGFGAKVLSVFTVVRVVWVVGVEGESVVSGECGKMVRVFSVLFFLRSFRLHCLFLAFLTGGDTVLVMVEL